MSSVRINPEIDFWQHFEVTKEDLDFINNHLFELETPQTTEQLLEALVTFRIQREKARTRSSLPTQRNISNQRFNIIQCVELAGR
jgi:hypothetical protein